MTTTVRYAGLTNRLIPAPGRITEVKDANDGEPSRGESWRFTERPSEGDKYRVTSRVVRATAEELAKVPIPEGETYDRVTRFWPRRVTDGRVEPLAKLADHMPAWVAVSPWADAIRLARRLSAGTTSELEVVRRVEAYLTGGRYRYTTDVDEPGPDPLLEFLFKTRAGYCQHFAGAATLLLRVAGIPTRVVSGFATGRRTGQDTYAVRDEDAHAWIEVYFPGYGWVPFNPTPADAEAEVAPEVDVLAAASRASGGGSGTPLAAAGVLGVVLLGAAVGARRRRSPVALGELLAGLAGESVGPSTTLSALRPRLAAIGPSIAALADQAERMRFAADGTPEPAYPRVRVWRALARERGALRATLMSARLATRPAPAARS